MKIKKAYFCIFFLSIVVLSCNTGKKKSRFPEFSESSSGLYYHRITIGEGVSYPENGDYLVLNLQFKTLSNKVLPVSIFKNELGWDTLHFKTSATKSIFYEALSMLSEGDSCVFIFNPKLAFDTTEFTGLLSIFKKDSLVKLEAKLISLKARQQEIQEKKDFQRLCAEMQQEEQLLIKQFVDSSRLNFPKVPESSGIYFKLIKNGSGKIVHAGDLITIRYTGKFLTGEIFDSSTTEKEALNFRLGEPGQVIRGLELALYKMHEGDIAEILVPSSLAFGSKGSAGGIVSPFKTVTFAVEILKIKS